MSEKINTMRRVTGMRKCAGAGKSMIGKRLFGVIVSFVFVLSLFSVCQAGYAGGMSDPLVNTQWLADNLEKPGIAIVYVGGPTSKKENFAFKHLPGAVFLDFFAFMGALGDGSAPPDKAKFEALMGGLGIGNDTHVILHSKGTLFSSGVFWLMDYFGHKKKSILDGGVTKWMKEGLPTSGGLANITPVTYKATPDASLLATADDVLNNLKNPKTVIVDTRGSDEYKGIYADEARMGNKRVGHVPGALDLGFYPSNLNNDGTFKSAGDLKAVYAAKGVTEDKEVVTYCQAGIRAAHSYFAIKHILGYPNVKNYVGSWGEWSTRLDPGKYPVEQ
jgi:thiosulfate/3-mercaptopyruvate sulfurtransferase